MSQSIQTLIRSSLLLLLMGLFSCQSSTTSTTAVEGKGLFRNVHFDMSSSAVKSAETANIKKESSNKLVYEEVISDSEFAYLTYDFTRGKLYKIQYDVYAETSNSAQKHYQAFVDQFNNKYEEKKAGSLWLGKEGDQRFSIFAKQLSSKKNPGLSVIYELL